MNVANMFQKKYSFEYKLGILFGLFLLGHAFFYSGLHNGGKLSNEDVERYLTKIETNLNWPAEVKKPMLERLRKWGKEDDGKQFFMLNMMRYRDQVYQFPNAIKNHTGSAKEANDIYEANSTLPLLSLGGTAHIWGEVQSPNITADKQDLSFDNWNRIGMARYPNRRAFFELMTDERYG